MAKDENNEDKKEGNPRSEEKEHKNKKEHVSVLKKKIEYLEEELVRKDKEIEKLKQENLILFRTALKRSEARVDEQKLNENQP